MKKDYIKLELDKVLSMLAEEAYSDACREKISQTSPLYSGEKIREEISKTSDAFRLSAKLGTPRFSNIKDPGAAVRRAEQGGSLSLRELLDIVGVLREIHILISWRKQYAEENSLSYLFLQLVPNRELFESIDVAVISEEELSDAASPELARLRRGIERQSGLIRERLDRLIKNADTKKYLQESLVTMRDGRFVIPVKTEHKNEIQGLVHDTSGSGATLFIEPIAVVEANNEIRLLKSREKAEIERIIAELSAMAGGFSDELRSGFRALVELETCFAKANLGAKMKGVIPEITDSPLLDLKNARHPLIPKEKAVPVTISIGYDYNCLIITGPNTGGKTVALKTAGLLALMARCGLMLPAADGSQVGVFGEIYADIGDEQSIEQSLSTFSSHMNNIIGILKTAEHKSLVLLDELGSGTDPSEGGALAVAILEYLKQRGCLVMATTHYQEVKMFAIGTDGVENASCEFDINTLRPTYRLITGAPGKSNALAIVRRLGMEEGVIGMASGLVSGENKRFEQVIEALEASRREIDALKEEAVNHERHMRGLNQELEKEKLRFEHFREKEMTAARQRAMSIIETVRVGAEDMLDELEELKRDKDKADFSDKVRGMRSKVNSALNKLHDTANPVEEKEKADYVLPRPLKMYDTVLLADIDKKGTLISLPDSSDNCLVQVGVMKTKTKAGNLRLIEQARVSVNGVPLDKSKPQVGSHVTVTKSAEGSYGAAGRRLNEIDIRGMTTDEGVAAADAFIDVSLMNNIGVVTVIHGKGTGALRQAVHGYLKGHKRVKSYRLGRFGEGEDGVTLVELY